MSKQEFNRVEIERIVETRSPSPSGYGWTNDGMYPFFPGTPCLHCGQFVGRDGIFNVEYWEMTSDIASMDAEHGECSVRADAEWRKKAATWAA